MPAPEPLLLERHEAARQLGISPGLLDRLARAGKAPAPVRLGRRKLWSRAALERFADPGAHNSAPNPNPNPNPNPWDDLI